MSFERGLWATTLVLLILSMPAIAQEYRFHGDSAVDEGTEENGGFSFPPNGYSPLQTASDTHEAAQYYRVATDRELGWLSAARIMERVSKLHGVVDMGTVISPGEELLPGLPGMPGMPGMPFRGGAFPV